MQPYSNTLAQNTGTHKVQIHNKPDIYKKYSGTVLYGKTHLALLDLCVQF